MFLEQRLANFCKDPESKYLSFALWHLLHLLSSVIVSKKHHRKKVHKRACLNKALLIDKEIWMNIIFMLHILFLRIIFNHLKI